MREYHLEPSMLSADFNRLGEQLSRIRRAGCEWLHVDVMDGLFVPSISFGMPVIRSIRKESSLKFDVHLMIQDPARYLEEFRSCGADLITVHAEACPDPAAALRQIRALGARAGISLCPETPLAALTDEILADTDLVLIMSVHPGFGGQAYLPESTEKIRRLRRMLDERGLTDVDIQVDGGINRGTIAEAVEAGANNLVAGSAVFAGDLEANVRELTGYFPRP